MNYFKALFALMAFIIFCLPLPTGASVSLGTLTVTQVGPRILTPNGEDWMRSRINGGSSLVGGAARTAAHGGLARGRATYCSGRSGGEIGEVSWRPKGCRPRSSAPTRRLTKIDR